MNDILLLAVLQSLDAGDVDTARGLADLAGDDAAIETLLADDVAESVQGPKGPPPFPGAVFDTGKHRWVKGPGGTDDKGEPQSQAAKPDPRAAAEAVKTHPSLAPLADKLDIRDADNPVVQRHLADLAELPASVHQELADAGVGVAVGAAMAAELDDMPKIANQQLRGWPKGSTWKKSKAAGVYNEGAKTVVAGAGKHGSESLILHEYGHAIDRTRKLSADPDGPLRWFHTRLYDKLDSYQKQDGPGSFAGAEEMFAESVAFRVKYGRETFKQKYNAGYLDWLDKQLGLSEKP